MRRWCSLLAIPFLLGPSACGQVDYDAAPVGKFEGSVILMWVDETRKRAGDGTFVYVPSKEPLVFIPSENGAWKKPIKPAMIYTDGASVPALLQPIPGFSPWGYAQAYMVHDWLFVANRCLTDGAAKDAEKDIDGMKFRQSAQIMAEMVKTMFEEGTVTPNDAAGRAISSAVAGPISRRLWDQRGACGAQRIKPQHRDQIERALGGPRAGFLRQRGVRPATIVAVFTAGQPGTRRRP